MSVCESARSRGLAAVTKRIFAVDLDPDEVFVFGAHQGGEQALQCLVDPEGDVSQFLQDKVEEATLTVGGGALDSNHEFIAVAGLADQAFIDRAGDLARRIPGRRSQG